MAHLLLRSCFSSCRRPTRPSVHEQALYSVGALLSDCCAMARYHCTVSVDPVDDAVPPCETAYFVSDDPNLQATAVNMDAFLRLKALLEQLSQPLEPYETVTAGKERSRQQQVWAASVVPRPFELRAAFQTDSLMPTFFVSLPRLPS